MAHADHRAAQPREVIMARGDVAAISGEPQITQHFE